MNTKELKEFCNSIGIKCVGIAGVGPYYDLERIIKNRLTNGYFTGMEEPMIEKRINPKATMGNAKSIIVCAFPYYIDDIESSNISKYCYGKDYHIVVKEKLETIVNHIKEKMDKFEYMMFTDNGPLVDRYLANISGVGYYGINNNIITDEYGSYVFIGYIINNYEFIPDNYISKTCIKCGKCISSCPGNAILGNFELNPKRCISYITQKKEDLTEEEIDIMKSNGKIFGCDICQDVCPHNKNINSTNIEDFYKDLMFNIDETEIENMSNKEFKRKYKDKAFSWRGRKIIKRNIDIVNGKSSDQ